MLWEIRSKFAFWLAFTAAKWVAPRYSLTEHLIGFSKEKILAAFEEIKAREEEWRV